MGAGASTVTNSWRVVVVGGGFAGIHFISRLISKKWLRRFVSVTLIERRDTLHHNLAACRSITQDHWAEKCFITYDSLLAKAASVAPGVLRRVMGELTQVEHKRVTVVDPSGCEIAVDYDKLVLATGTNTALFPGKDLSVTQSAGNLARYRSTLAAVKASHRVAVVGGGPTGVELAAEVAYAYPGKDVALFHAHAALLGSSSRESKLKPDVAAKLQRKLAKELGVKLVLGERVDEEALAAVPRAEHLPAEVISGPVMVSTHDGTAWEADFVLMATGAAGPSTTFSSSPLLAPALDTEGRLKVDQFLQVETCEGHIYAIGDCSALAEPKSWFCSKAQGRYVAGRLAALAVLKLGRKPPSSAYALVPEFLLVPTGPGGGVGQLPNGMMAGDSMVANVSARTRLLEDTNKAMFVGFKPSASPAKATAATAATP